MDRKWVPLIMMLTAGAVTCVINLIRQYPMQDQLIVLFIVLVVFYILGCVFVWTLNLFDRQNEKKLPEEGEVIEKVVEQEEQETQEN